MLTPIDRKRIAGKTRDVTTRVAVKSGGSSAVALPLAWLGKKVMCVLMEDEG